MDLAINFNLEYGKIYTPKYNGNIESGLSSKRYNKKQQDDSMLFSKRRPKKKLYDPFLWMGFNCLKATTPLQGGSLLFTTKFPEISGTHLIDLGKMKG